MKSCFISKIGGETMNFRTYFLVAVLTLMLSVGGTILGLKFLQNKAFPSAQTSSSQEVPIDQKASSDVPSEKKDPANNSETDLSDYHPNEVVASEERLKALLRKQIADFRPSQTYHIDSTILPSIKMEKIFEQAVVGLGANYTVTSWNYTFKKYSDHTILDANMQYHTTKSQDRSVNQFAKQWVEGNLRMSMSDESKVKTIHDYIIHNSRYDKGDADHNFNGCSVHSAYTLSKEKVGVCQAYAILFQKLATEAGIPNQFVYGDFESPFIESDDNVYHLWNMVRIDDQWYHIDLTADDPVVENSPNTSILSYDHYLKSDAYMAQTHTWDMMLYPSAPEDYPVYYEEVIK